MSLQASDLEREGPCKFFIPYSLDCEVSHSFPTLKEAVECAKKMLEDLESDVAYGDYWHEDMDIFKIVDAAGAVYYRFKRIDEVHKPDDIDEDGYSESIGEYWDPRFEYTCGYELREVVEKVRS